ncbi:DEAD/DEAH box helicase family protein, partial [bacterium]|nr:DEAD/DEAH box helicase family protein [bacterium]
MSRTIEQLLPERPEARLRIYAYSIHDPAHKGLLKVGQTTQDVRKRVNQQLKTAAIENYTIELDESAEREDGTLFSDHDVRYLLKAKRFENTQLEWMRCGVSDVHAAITELRTGVAPSGTRHEAFPMRAEQADAVDKTADYFESIWQEDGTAVPRFLWNAKMRFGKTFASYQLAKRLDAKKVLVLTFKPAVGDAWQTDLETHVDFDGWQYLTKTSDGDPSSADKKRPLVYFGSFQDLLGRKNGRIKAKNEWLHATNWDLVIFDEYHFGAWRDSAKELFEGEDEAVAKKEVEAEYASVLDTFGEGLEELSGNESDFLPITTHAYLYLSGTPFKALATGEFIEEQIFNWTYSDEQRAKRQFAVDHPDSPNSYEALPEMRLFTYKMPEELIAVAHGGEFDEFDLNTFFEATG